MADMTDVYTALEKAHAAGDTASAKALADYITSQQTELAASSGEEVSAPAPALAAPVGEGMPAPRTQKDPYAIGTRAIVGAAAGATTPELTMLLGKGLQYVPAGPLTPATKAAGLALEKGAPFMKTVAGRVVPAVAGFFGGGAGEYGKQELEIAGVRPSVANLAGTGIEMATQPLGDLAATIASSTVRGAPIVGQVLSDVAKRMGIDVAKLSSAETKILSQEIARLRGAAPDAASALYKELEAGAGRIVGEADAAALARQTKAASDYTAEMTAAGRVPSEADKLVADARNRVHDIGNADVELTDIGARQRGAVSKQFSEEKLARDQDYQALKAQRDADVAARENTGDYISNMPEYKQLTDRLDKILVPRGATAPETEKSTLAAYGEIKSALSPRMVPVADAQEAQQLAAQGVKVQQIGDKFFGVYEPSFNAIDTVRRKLGDAAFGQGEEGFKALGQARAKDFYGYLSDLQSKYAGQAQDELQGGYEMASGLLDRFKGGAGAKVLKTERLSPDMYTKDPKDVPASFFRSRDGVTQLSAIAKDPALVEETARDYVARSLKGKSADEAEKWLRSNSDFLSAPELKTVLQKSVDYVAQLRGAEGKSTGMLAGAKAKEAGAKESFNLGVAEAKDIAAQGRATAKNILADRFGVDRVNSLLSSTNKTEWESVASALSTSQAGRDLLTRSIEQRLASVAEDALNTGRRINASAELDKITEPLLATGLIDQAKIASIKTQLNKIEKPELAKLSWLKTQGLRALFSTGLSNASTAVINNLAPPSQNSLATQTGQ